MKIALVHELLTMKGGAERVLKVLADMYPNAPIYTLLYNKDKLGDWFEPSRVITPKYNPLLSLAPAKIRYNHHLYLSKFPTAVESWKFEEYDLVISASSAFAHGIITNQTPHICYTHSPARYLWDRTIDVQKTASKGMLGPLKKMYLSHTFHPLRQWDSEVAHRPHVLLAASEEVKRRIELYWRRQSEVLYPPIDDFWHEKFTHPAPPSRLSYLLVSSLVPYKRIDIAVQACSALNVPLKIVGRGPDLARLQAYAGSSVEFLGYVDDTKLRNLYYNAKAVIFPGDEDFGLVPLEAMSQGTPVIAYKSGGALETVIEGSTGLFFDHPTAESLWKTLEKFDTHTFSSEQCKAQSAKFTKESFINGMKQVVQTVV